MSQKLCPRVSISFLFSTSFYPRIFLLSILKPILPGVSSIFPNIIICLHRSFKKNLWHLEYLRFSSNLPQLTLTVHSSCYHTAYTYLYSMLSTTAIFGSEISSIHFSKRCHSFKARSIPLSQQSSEV